MNTYFITGGYRTYVFHGTDDALAAEVARLANDNRRNTADYEVFKAPTQNHAVEVEDILTGDLLDKARILAGQ